MREVVLLLEGGPFYYDLCIRDLYKYKSTPFVYADEYFREVEKSKVLEWVKDKYFNNQKCEQWNDEHPYDRERSPEELYQTDEEYKKAVDEERLYIMYLMGIDKTAIAKHFGYSRPTVYTKIKQFEENRLQEFLCLKL